MSGTPFLFLFWLSFLVPAGPALAGCWFFGRRRVTWEKWETAILLAPYLVWLILVIIDCKGKSLSNVIVEPFCLGCGVALACITRVAVGRKLNEETVAIALFVASCVLAIALWAFVPALPE